MWSNVTMVARGSPSYGTPGAILPMTLTTDRALIIFGKEFPDRDVLAGRFDAIIADKVFEERAQAMGCRFVDVESLVSPGSVYEAGALLEELSRLTLPGGSRVAASFLYEGYELWW